MKPSYGWLALFCLAIFIACAFRLPDLASRPMHGDEAVHAIKFGQLIEHGTYVYDPYEYHGPTLNYLTLLPARLTGKVQLTQIDERHLRIVPVVFGILLILFLAPLASTLGWASVAVSALLIAISPAMVFYSRYYIQEMLLVCFAFGLIASGFLWTRHARRRWALLAGAFLGLLHATKETFVIFVGAMLLAGVLTSWFVRRGTNGASVNAKLLPQSWFHHFAGALLAAALISILFYSSFFSNPHGIFDSLTTFKTYLGRASESSYHLYPWHTYFSWLFCFSYPGSNTVYAETPILPFAVAGLVFAFSPKNRDNYLLPFIAMYTMILSIAFSFIPYKTPWNALGLLHGMLVLAGIGVVEIYRRLSHKMLRRSFVLIVFIAVALYGWQSDQLNNRFEADAENNPYVYAHPTKDVFIMSRRIKSLAAAHENAEQTYVQFSVSASDYWPFPWYLRDLPNVGWWDKIDENAPAAPIIIISPDLRTGLAKKLYEQPPPGQRPLYVPTFEEDWQLRPGVTLQGYATKELWDQFNRMTK